MSNFSPSLFQLLTPKEALESLMAKDPYNPTVKAFKKNGLLEEILYPDGRPEGRSNDRCVCVLCHVV